MRRLFFAEADFFSAPNQMVTFHVGSGSRVEIFQVHKEFACHHSVVFEKAFNGDFIEGRTQTYTLNDVTPDVFRFITQWLYKQKLKLSCHDEDDDDETSDQADHTLKCSKQNMLLVQLWVLADRLCIDYLQNVVMDHILRIQQKCRVINVDCFSYIYENTREGSPLRELAVDQVAWLGSPDTVRAFKTFFPHEMLVDLFQVVAKQVTKHARQIKSANMAAHKYHVTEDSS